jgi:hypothetical protein
VHFAVPTKSFRLPVALTTRLHSDQDSELPSARDLAMGERMVLRGCQSQRTDVAMDEGPLAVRREGQLRPQTSGGSRQVQFRVFVRS